MFLDFPVKPQMLALDLPLVKRDGAETISELGIPRLAAELSRSARRLRVFVRAPATVPARAIVGLVMMPQRDVVAKLEGDGPLLSG
jgi:hypothetical protein